MIVRYLSAEKMSKDDFGVLFTNKTGEVVYDAQTLRWGWATMTESSWKAFGAGKLGLGLGQKYVRQENGELHKVEG
jgi:hypothetical protein